MFVEDYMTPNPKTVSPDGLLGEAQDLLTTSRLHHLPVLDESRRLVGIISDRDIRSAIGYDRSVGSRLTVSEVMTPEPTTIARSATLDEALATLCASRFGALPVVNQHALVGIITRSDLLRAFHEVLGLDRSGRRVEVGLPNGVVDLVATFEALKPCGEDVISAVVSPMRRDGAEPSLYLRLAGTESRRAEQLLRDAAVIVLMPEHP